MAKDYKTSPKAAYKVVPNCTAEEAADKGYVVVENNADGTAPVFGYYENTATGAAMEILADKDEREPVPAGGEPVAMMAPGNKGALVNPDDPVVHGTADNNPHADGAKPNATRNDDLKLEGYTPGDDLKPGRKPKA